MTVTDAAQIADDLRATATWLKDHEWHQGRMYRVQFGATPSQPWQDLNEADITHACAYGALMIVTGDRTTGNLSKGSRTYEAYHTARQVTEQDLISYNDQAGVTKDDILKFLCETADKIERGAFHAG